MLQDNNSGDETEHTDDGGIKRRDVLRSTAGAVAVGGLAGVASGDSSGKAGEYNVGIKPGAKGKGTDAAKNAADSVRKSIDFGDIGKTVVGKFSEKARKGLENNPNIEFIEENGEAHKLAEKLPVGIDRVDADVLHSDGTTGSGATIAILDSGVDDDHPDLADNIDPSLGAAFETACGDESGGCRYGAEGYNGNDCNYAWSDDDDHGSHVAGSANAVEGNNEGVAGGVSTEATIMPVKVLTGCGSGTFSAISDGIKYAADNGADVINMSLGASSGDTTLKNACQYAYDKGVVIVASAGNSGPCTDCVGFPAAYSTVIAVSAIDGRDDTLADFSSTGPEVEITAPGVGTLSTIPPESDDGSTYENGYEEFSGTSMSAPHVAGAAAQVVASDDTLSNADVRQQLKDTAENIGLAGNESGAGLLDAEAAVGGSSGGDAAPSVSWVNPADGDTVSGTVTVQISASDSEDSDDSLSVSYSVDGGSSRTATYNSTSGYYEDSWDTTTVADGDNTLQASATDSAGNTSTSSITVTTDNTESAPTVDSLSASEVETSDGDAEFDVSWQVGDGDGDLSSVDLTLTQDSDGTQEDTASVSVSGSSASGTTRLVAAGDDGSGNSYTVDATVTDSGGNTGSGSTTVSETEDTASAPTVDSHAVSTRTTGPWTRVTADWAVSDADGDLSSVEVAIEDSGGATIDSTTVNVSGSSASGSNELRNRGSVSTSVVTVTDSKGNSDTSSKSV